MIFSESRENYVNLSEHGNIGKKLFILPGMLDKAPGIMVKYHR